MTSLTAVQVGAGWFSESPGGLDRYYHDLIEALPGAGVQCRGLVVGSADVDQETDGTVRAFALPDESIFRRWRKARQAVARLWNAIPPGENRVLVTHFALYGYPLIKERHYRPWVMHFHGPWAAESQKEGASGLVTWIKRRLEVAVYRHPERIIVLSEAFRTLLCETYGVDPDRVTVIPGGVDIDRFAIANQTSRAAARAQFGWAIDRPIVLSARRLTSRMGLEALVDAIGIVRKTVPNVLCPIAGRGPLAESLVKRISAAGLSDNVTLLGFVPDEDLPLAYRAADLSIMPSESLEGFGLSAAESLAAGTPVLVTPVGGLPEVVRGLSPGLVMANTSAAAMGAAIANALTHPSSLPSTETCQAYAAKTFAWEVIAARIARVYSEAIEQADRNGR